jgi:glycosyltransferase involved in cell wall biosynthesis
VRSPSTRDGGDVVTPLRVCHVIHSLQAGGAEESLATLGDVARDAGLELEVLSLLPVTRGGVAGRLSDAGVRVTTLGLGTRWDARALRSALAFLRERSPDVVHTHLKHADIVGAYAARRAGIPMVSTLHVVEDRPRAIGRVKRNLGARARRIAAATTIAVSDAQRTWYLRNLDGDARRVVTVHNGVSNPTPLGAEARAALRDSLGVARDELMAVTIALMRAGKGHEDVLALAEAVGPGAGVRFVFVGDGELRHMLERRACEHAASSAPVVFAGFREDVPAILAASDLVIHPSHADALPTALLHAVAAGRATLAYAVGGVPEIITPEAGVLVPPRDRAALLGGLRRLLSAEARDRLGRGARARYEEEFTLARWLTRLRHVYTLAIETPRAARSLVHRDGMLDRP